MMGSAHRRSGQGSLEYLCVLAVAAAVVALLPGLQPGIGGWAATTVGSITASMDGAPRTTALPAARPTAQSGSGGGGGIIRGLADVAGFVPVVGDFVDAGVCAFEVAQGNFGDAALSCASAVPFLGTGANAARVAKELVAVTMAAGAGTVTATAAHPFFVTGIQRWVEAGDLPPGDELMTPDRRGIRVQDVRRFGDDRTVHNLSVETIPTFYEGREPVLVHNCNLGPQAALRDVSIQCFRFGNETFLLDKRGMDHILARHHPTYWDGTTRRTQTFFDPSTSVADVQRLAGDVLRQGRVGQFLPVHQ